jgi:hypothetical protein
MSLLRAAIGDEPAPTSDRSYIERNAIALLSTCSVLDLPSPNWIGRRSLRDPIRRTDLWNVNHVDEPYTPRFLDVLAEYVAVTLGMSPRFPEFAWPTVLPARIVV